MNLIKKQKKRHDGRKNDEIRPLTLNVGVLPNADGSAEIKLGGNWIIAGVYGPKEHHPKMEVSQERAVLKCRYSMAPYSVKDRKNPRPSRRETEISKVIREALSASIFLEEFPEAGIQVYIEVLQAEGSTRVASICAASLALADAGIPMRDLVAATSSGKVDEKIVLDIGEIEDFDGDADVPIAVMPNRELVTLLQMDGQLSHKEFKKTFNLAIDGCKQIYDLQVNALEAKIRDMESEE